MPGGTAFKRLWAASAASNLGDGIGLVAVPLLAATLTRQPFWISTIAAVAFLPYLLLAAPLGVLVDRFERRRSMILANIVRIGALSVMTVLVATDLANVVWLIVGAFILASAECVFDVAAETALTDVVTADELDDANSRLQTTMYVSNMFLGGPVGAGLFALAAALPFGAQLLGHLAATGLILGLPAPAAPETPPETAEEEVHGAWAELREGVAWLVRHRSIRALALVTAVIAFGQQAASAITVLFVLDTLGGSDLSFGLLTMVAAVGAILGSTMAPSLAGRVGRGRAMMIGALVLPLAMAGIGIAPGVVVVALILPAFSASIGLWNVLSVSLRQELVPTRLAGRVFGAWRAVVMGALPLGAWSGGAMASHWGLRAPWLVGAGLCVLGGLAAVGALSDDGSSSRAGPQPSVSGSSAS